MALTTATFLGIDNAYDANFPTFTNANLAGPAGVMFALVLTGVISPFGARAAPERLPPSTWTDVILSVSGLSTHQQRDLSARMLDRLTQLIPRLDPSDDEKHTATESPRDMRIAINALDLCRLPNKLAGELSAALN